MKKEKTTPFTLSKEEMRVYGYKVVDIIADHFDNISSKNISCLADRKEMEAILKEDEIPTQGSEPLVVLDHVLNHVMSHVDLLTHPKFYSFVPSPNNFISTMADTLSTGYNIFSGGWSASPAAAEVEIISLNWLLKIFRFPEKQGGGIFTSGGSMANLTALATARRIKCGEDFSKAIIYLSDQAHSSNIKAIRILGFKQEQLRIIPTDGEFKIAINKLKNAIAKDKIDGLTPFCILASAGTTNTGTVDPLDDIAQLCENENMWMHVDAAYGGAAILADKGYEYLKGIERADSVTVDPHKWFFQPYEIGCLLVKDHRWLSKTFTEKPEYLRDIEGNESEINFYDHGIELTRRFRALKFYMSVKTYGLDAFKAAINYNIELTERLETKLRESAKWEIISPATLAVINFRYHPMHISLSENELDALNQFISKQIIAHKEAVLVTTILNHQVVLRMCLINPKTTFDDLMESINQLENYAETFLSTIAH